MITQTNSTAIEDTTQDELFLIIEYCKNIKLAFGKCCMFIDTNVAKAFVIEDMCNIKIVKFKKSEKNNTIEEINMIISPKGNRFESRKDCR